VARRALSGVVLVGGASSRFGSPKALARIDDETFVDRARRILGEACDEVLVVGKAGELPFDVIDDLSEVRAPIAGVVAGLRAAANDVVVFLPVDCPRMTSDVVRALGDACRDAAVPQTGPLPGAWAKSALPVLEWRLANGPLALYRAYEELNVAELEIDPRVLADVDTPGDLASL
jgi:molybdopterin-guanine dinucleotide biosynthesis protein A